jgi:hypothetical protein
MILKMKDKHETLEATNDKLAFRLKLRKLRLQDYKANLLTSIST